MRFLLVHIALAPVGVVFAELARRPASALLIPLMLGGGLAASQRLEQISEQAVADPGHGFGMEAPQGVGRGVQEVADMVGRQIIARPGEGGSPQGVAQRAGELVIGSPAAEGSGLQPAQQARRAKIISPQVCEQAAARMDGDDVRQPLQGRALLVARERQSGEAQGDVVAGGGVGRDQEGKQRRIGPAHQGGRRLGPGRPGPARRQRPDHVAMALLAMA